MASILIGLAVTALLYKSQSRAAQRVWKEATAIVGQGNDEPSYPKNRDPRKFGGSLRGPTYNNALPKWSQRLIGIPASIYATTYSIDNAKADSVINHECKNAFTERYKQRYLAMYTHAQDQNHWRLDPIRGQMPRVSGAPIQIIEPNSWVVPRWAVSKGRV